MLLAASASAVIFSMSGKYGTENGPFVNLPATGPVTCAELTGRIGFPAATMLVATQPGSMLLPPTPGPGAPALPFGCIPGGSSIPGRSGQYSFPAGATAVGGAFSVPVGFFSLGPPAGTGVRNAPIPALPKLIQLATALSNMGPAAVSTLAVPRNGSMIGTSAPAAWRAFKAGAWTSQTGRAGSHFTWCPAASVAPLSMGIGGGGTTPGAGCASAAAGTGQRIVRYDPKGSGVGGFGGTMATMLVATATASSIGVLTPFGGAFGPLSVGFNIVGGAGSQNFGRGYADYQTPAPGILPSGPIFMSHTKVGTAPSSVIGMVSGGVVGAIPAGTFTDAGFPWTTGRVVVRNTGKTGGGMANPQTVTASGTDMITGGGARNIQLVAGQLAAAVVGVASFTPGLAHMSIFLPEPTLASGLVAGLLGIAVLRRRRSKA